jgi:hypothetical protein
MFRRILDSAALLYLAFIVIGGIYCLYTYLTGNDD